MSKLPMIARILLGLIFFVFGLNGFLNFLPAPPMPEAAGAFAGALAATGYMFPLIKGIEVLVGLLLISNKFVPLALLLLAPVTVNIVLFHAVLAPAGLVLPIIILIIHLYLAYTHKNAYAQILK